MADKKPPLVNGHFYHVYNRGVAKQPTFLDKRDYDQAALALSYYRFRKPPIKLSRFRDFAKEEQEKLLTNLQNNNDLNVKIISYVLMPNHFHFLLQQVTEDGISNFISKFTNSYTKYFNIKRDRVGPVFQGVFKAVLIESDEQLLHLSRYIHLNPVISVVIRPENLNDYQWSSWKDYLQGQSKQVWMEPVLEHFSQIKEYEQFVLDQVDYGKQQKMIEHLILE